MKNFWVEQSEVMSCVGMEFYEAKNLGEETIRTWTVNNLAQDKKNGWWAYITSGDHEAWVRVNYLRNQYFDNKLDALRKSKMLMELEIERSEKTYARSIQLHREEIDEKLAMLAKIEEMINELSSAP